jgi:polysaccharide biosynthesis protein PslH
MPQSVPQILYVTSVHPHAREYGAQQRVLNICRLLKRHGSVSVVLLSDTPVDADSLRETEREFQEVIVFVLEAAQLATLWQRVRFELDPNFVNTSFFQIGAVDRQTLLKKIANSDLVWIHTIRTANECGIYRWPKSILDLDDLPSQLNASNAKVQRGIVRRLKTARMSMIWRRRERRVFERFDMVTVCSEPDRRYLGGDWRVSVVPNGFEEPPIKPLRALALPPRLGFIGGLWGLPNQDGVDWFIESVWPTVKSSVPGARLRIVGGGGRHNLANDGPDIDQLGFVVDPSEEISTWSAMIVPIRIGGGTRVKIAQAFSRNCPVVSTPLGAYGYSVRDGEDILIADSKNSFAAACIRLIEDPTLGSNLAEKAWLKFQKDWTWRAVGESLARTVGRVIPASEFAVPRLNQSRDDAAALTVRCKSNAPTLAGED